MARISYILPIYNSEEYLDKCISSLFSQGLNEGEFEIVLVNDGSTDRSLSKCNEYAKNYPSVFIIDQDNHGVGSARNAGMSIASGDYLCFVDPDDSLSPGSMKYLLENFPVGDYDLIRYWARIVDGDHALGNTFPPGEINYAGDADNYISKFGIDTFCWSFLYRKEWLQRSGIRFSEHIIAEDFLFISKVLLSKPQILSTTCLIYNYVKYPTSVTGDRSPQHSSLCVKTFVNVFDELICFARSKKIDDNPSLMALVFSAISQKMRSFCSRVMTSDLSFKQIKVISRHLREQGIIPMKTVRKGKHQRMLAFFVFFSLSNPCLLIAFRPLYKRVFIPFIFPMLSKN